jgi:hypothetical protein
LEEAMKKHEEKAMLTAERQHFNAEMGVPEIRNERRNLYNGLEGRLTNADLARAAMTAPASLAGINLIRGVHVPLGKEYEPWQGGHEDDDEFESAGEPEPVSMADASDAEMSASSSVKRGMRGLSPPRGTFTERLFGRRPKPKAKGGR